MVDLEVAAALEAARELVRRKAWTLAHRAGFQHQDVDDLAQTLTLRLLSRLPGYDPTRLRINGFVDLILRQGTWNLIRDRRTRSRVRIQEEVDVDALPANDPGPDQRDLTIDLAEFLRTLDASQRQLIDALLNQPDQTAAARFLAVARTTLVYRLRDIRERARQAGLDQYLSRKREPRTPES